ncbi:hypothetical protein, partial [Leyella stercorea]|uniref:hypothetical protein n=1 Tax=Leyella stercorea TaxID=363265 RepID=UPI0026713FD2
LERYFFDSVSTSIADTLTDRLGDRLGDKSFWCLSASLYSVDTQRDVSLLEDMADIFINSIFV